MYIYNVCDSMEAMERQPCPPFSWEQSQMTHSWSNSASYIYPVALSGVLGTHTQGF